MALCLTECKANFATEFIIHILNALYALCFALAMALLLLFFFFRVLFCASRISFVCWFTSVRFCSFCFSACESNVKMWSVAAAAVQCCSMLCVVVNVIFDIFGTSTCFV